MPNDTIISMGQALTFLIYIANIVLIIWAVIVMFKGTVAFFESMEISTTEDANQQEESPEAIQQRRALEKQLEVEENRQRLIKIVQDAEAYPFILIVEALISLLILYYWFFIFIHANHYMAIFLKKFL